MPPKLVVMLSDVIAEPLTKLINASAIQSSIFPSCEKVASVTPVFKKDDRLDKKNYRPLSVLDVFSKIFERFLLNQILPFLNKIQSVFLSAYRARYSSQHVLLRLIEGWRHCLDENKVAGAILMDLSVCLMTFLLQNSRHMELKNNPFFYPCHIFNRENSP